MTSVYSEVHEKFISLFNSEPVIVRSPGRINLIGEHTDYNGGFVMPAAINYDTVFAVAPANDGVAEIYSVKYNERFAVNTVEVAPVEKPKWANYLIGVIKQLQLRGFRVAPFKCVFGGNVPLGAGLSSSASVECGFIFALNELNRLELPRIEMIHIAQWAEHNFAGVKCGIMDQFASMMGKKDHVIVLDCRSLEFRYSPLRLPDHEIVLCDTNVKHSLVDSEYNQRRLECEAGVALLKKHYPEVTTLRDASEDMLRRHANEFPHKVFDRCLYVVQEIRRVEEAASDLAADRLNAFGEKMYQTHEGLSRLYEVSCEELDFLVNEAKSFQVVGSRMMGGGFGGCTINIIHHRDTHRFIEAAGAAYKQKFGIDMGSYVVSLEDGTSTIKTSHEYLN